MPSVEELLTRIRDNLRSDRFLLRNYTYNEALEVQELDKHDKLKKTETKEFEVFPSTVDELHYRRLVKKDGKPVGEKKLREQDRKHQKKVAKAAKKARKRGVASDSEMEAGEEEALLKEQRSVEEVFRLFEFKVVGREDIDGRSALVVDFSPRPEYKVKVKDVKRLKKVAGRAWVDEDDYQLVRVEAETIGTLRIGLGVIAKLNKGASLVFQRRKVNEEIWLPAEASFSGRGRILVFKGFRFYATSRYYDHKKFTVDSSVAFPSEPSEEKP